jgi:hypothetical protein
MKHCLLAKQRKSIAADSIAAEFKQSEINPTSNSEESLGKKESTEKA